MSFIPSLKATDLRVNPDEDACAVLLALAKCQQQTKSPTREQIGNINLPNAGGGDLAGDVEGDEKDVKEGSAMSPTNYQDGNINAPNSNESGVKTQEDKKEVAGKPSAEPKGKKLLPMNEDAGPRHDRSGNVIDCNQDDVFLSFQDPVYKAVMFDQFRRIGTRESREAATEMFNMFKQRGGRFFKLIHRTTQFVQVDEKVALASE